jgi:hypothetical protein
MAATSYSFNLHESEVFKGPQTNTGLGVGRDKFIYTIAVTVNGTATATELPNSYIVTGRIKPEADVGRRRSNIVYIEGINLRDNLSAIEIQNIMKAFIGYLSRKYPKVTFIIGGGTLLDIPTLMQMFNSNEFKRDFGYAVFYDEELTINPVPIPEGSFI